MNRPAHNLPDKGGLNLINSSPVGEFWIKTSGMRQMFIMCKQAKPNINIKIQRLQPWVCKNMLGSRSRKMLSGGSWMHMIRFECFMWREGGILLLICLDRQKCKPKITKKTTIDKTMFERRHVKTWKTTSILHWWSICGVGGAMVEKFTLEVALSLMTISCTWDGMLSAKKCKDENKKIQKIKTVQHGWKKGKWE